MHGFSDKEILEEAREAFLMDADTTNALAHWFDNGYSDQELLEQLKKNKDLLVTYAHDALNRKVIED